MQDLGQNHSGATVDGLVRVYGPGRSFLGVADASQDRVVARRLIAVNAANA
jgi:hypothetical protein